YVPDGGCIGYPKYLGAEGVEEFAKELVEQAGVLLLPASIYKSDLDLHRRIAFESGTAATILKPGLRQCGITFSGGNRDDFRAAGACFTRSHPGGNQAVGRNQRRALSFDCPVARPSPISDARATGLRRSSGRLPHQVRPYIGPPVVRREDCFQRLPE